MEKLHQYFMKSEIYSSFDGKSILYHLHILDEKSEVSIDLSEYPC